MFKVGDVVKVVDARAGCKDGPSRNGIKVPYYEFILGKEITIHRFDKQSNCFYSSCGDSFYPWRLELVNFSLENE